MNAYRPRQVQLQPPPLVQVHGDLCALRGDATRDAFRAIVEGIKCVRDRDGIEPPERLLEVLAGLKLAGDVRTDIPDVRKPAAQAPLRADQRVGIEEVAGMCDVGVRQARRLARDLGGTKTSSGAWVFDRRLVEAYLRNKEKN